MPNDAEWCIMAQIVVNTEKEDDNICRVMGVPSTLIKTIANILSSNKSSTRVIE